MKREKVQAEQKLAPDSTGAREPRVVFFSVSAPAQSRVFLAGTFNQWEQAPMQGSEDGCYVANLLLAPGRYEYKYVIDGTWRLDPNCRQQVPNGLGSANSMLEVS